MNRDQLLARLREFIAENFLYMRPDFVIGDHDSLLGRGIIDSMGVMEVIEFLHDAFGVTVEDVDITEANLGTLSAICDYVLAHGGDSGKTAPMALRMDGPAE